MHRIFVYGTLKRGQPNHNLMNDNKLGISKFIGSGQTKHAFPLVIAGPFNVPYCVAKEGQGKPVRGDLYEVDDMLLASLDTLECIPVHYQRLTRTICLDTEVGGDSNPTEVEAFVYQLCDYKQFVLNLPFYHDYDSLGTHGLVYVPFNARDKSRSWDEILEKDSSK